jgi:hypothetical protein
MQSFPLAFCMIVFRHTVGPLWTSDQPVSETTTCTGQHNIETQETNIHALSGIQTRDPSNQAAADLRLRPRKHATWHSKGMKLLLSSYTTKIFRSIAVLCLLLFMLSRCGNKNLSSEIYQVATWNGVRVGALQNLSVYAHSHT